jgi:AcrR family transcriptional regulator
MDAIILAVQQATRGRRTQQERRAETVARVLEAAIDLVAKGGLKAVTLAAVGTEAGYSRGIVSHHFGSRRALLDALAREVQRRFAPRTSTGDGLARVLDLVDAYLAALGERHRDAQVFLILWSEAIASDEDLRPIFAERDEAFRTGMADAVRAGVTDGSIRGDADPAASAVALVGLLRGVGLQRLLTPESTDLAAVRREVEKLLRGGLAPNAAGRAGGRRPASPRRRPSS